MIQMNAWKSSCASQERETIKRQSQILYKKKDSIRNLKECPICKETLESKVSKMEHISLVHPERKIHDCQYCDFKCLLSKTLKTHKSYKHPKQHCDPNSLRI